MRSPKRRKTLALVYAKLGRPSGHFDALGDRRRIFGLADGGRLRRLLEGSTYGEALRAAQLSMVGRKGHEAPYLWVAFTLTGDPRSGWTR